MKWNGHRAFIFLITYGILPPRFLYRFKNDLEEASVYPDKREVWSQCAPKWRNVPPLDVYGPLSPTCPLPPPKHHVKTWSILAIEYYTVQARLFVYRYGQKRIVNDETIGRSFAHFIGVLSHFIADAVISPWDVNLSLADVLGLGDESLVEWEYRPFAYPLSDATEHYWNLVRTGKEEVPRVERPTARTPKTPLDLVLGRFELLPGDYVHRAYSSLREEGQRLRQRLVGNASSNLDVPQWSPEEAWERMGDFVKRLVAEGRRTVRLVWEGRWFASSREERLVRRLMLVPTFALEVKRQGGVEVWK